MILGQFSQRLRAFPSLLILQKECDLGADATGKGFETLDMVCYSSSIFCDVYHQFGRSTTCFQTIESRHIPCVLGK